MVSGESSSRGVRWGLALLLVTVSSAIDACAYDARLSDCAVRCDNNSGCPDGLACGAEGLCRSPGAIGICSTILDDAGSDAWTQFSSCDNLAATCGPGANDSCCATATTVPGGTFYRSYDVAADGMYPSMSYPATIGAFVLDKYEVTVGRFRKFVEAQGGTQLHPPAMDSGTHPHIANSGWDSNWNANLASDTATLIAHVKCDGAFQSWTDATGANENLPMNCITWYEAMAFCIWDGGYPPTEAEWNYAAAGGDEQRAYPWASPAGSTAIDCSYANFSNGSYCVGSVNRVGSESPKGDGKWGQSDLGGNVQEWTLDWYASPYAQNTCAGCANLTAASDRAFRGGSYGTGVRGAIRGGVSPANRSILFGARCARSAS